MSLFNTLSKSKVVFQLQIAGKRVGERIEGKQVCQLPKRAADAAFTYPAYEVVTANGETEIMEHKKMEPLFYVTDDPAIWKQYSAGQCH